MGIANAEVEIRGKLLMHSDCGFNALKNIPSPSDRPNGFVLYAMMEHARPLCHRPRPFQ